MSSLYFYRQSEMLMCNTHWCHIYDLFHVMRRRDQVSLAHVLKLVSCLETQLTVFTVSHGICVHSSLKLIFQKCVLN